MIYELCRHRAACGRRLTLVVRGNTNRGGGYTLPEVLRSMWSNRRYLAGICPDLVEAPEMPVLKRVIANTIRVVAYVFAAVEIVLLWLAAEIEEPR